MKKLFLVSLTVIMVVGLVVGLALPGLAKTDQGTANGNSEIPGRQVFKGEVIDIDYDEYCFTIETESENERTIQVNEATRFFQINTPQRIMEEMRTRERLQDAEGFPEQVREEFGQRMQPEGGFLNSIKGMFQRGQGQKANNESTGNNETAKKLQGNLCWLYPFGDEVTFEDLEEGDRVAVFVVETDDGDGYLAKQVFIIEPSEYGRVTGEIINIDGDSINIATTSENEDDTPEEFYYDGDTIFSLRLQGTYTLVEGMTVTIIYIEDEDGDYYATTVTSRLICNPD